MTDTYDPAELFRRATESTARALSGREDVEVALGGLTAEMTEAQIRLPSPPLHIEENQVAHLRGMADMLALQLRYHDTRLHQRLMPADPRAREAYQALENARIEAVGTADYPGAASNVAAALKFDARKRRLDLVTARDDVSIGEALRYLAREAFTGRRPPPEAERITALWRPWLNEHLGATGLEALKAALHDQTAFARLAYSLIERMEMTPAPADPLPDDNSGDGDDAEKEEGQEQAREGEQQSGERKEQLGLEAAEEDQEATGADSDMQGGYDLDERDKAQSEGDSEAPRRNAPDGRGAMGEYRIYTDAFDETVEAGDLCDHEELEQLRRLLDKQLTHLHGVITRLANRLQRKLMAQQARTWHFDLEEGLLDSARLSRIVANPMFPVSYKQESNTPFRDTVVTLLIDNSGSMRGRPITIAAISTDILARTLERCGVRVEILGFTTRAWKGGASREKWLSDGKPAHPGRLNDLRHIVYKNADEPWRHVRANLGLMLREGLLKENIDGEALLWACNRLLARPEQRRILMVVSDGAPVDDSTLSANQGTYLEDHLRQMISWIETRTPVQLVAIGIGHDVTRYYRRAVTLADADELGGVLTEKLAELFDEAPAARKGLTPRPGKRL